MHTNTKVPEGQKKKKVDRSEEINEKQNNRTFSKLEHF